MSTIQIEKNLNSLGSFFHFGVPETSLGWIQDSVESLVLSATRVIATESVGRSSDADIGVVDLLRGNLVESDFKYDLIEMLEEDSGFANDLYSAVATLESNPHVSRVDLTLDSEDGISSVVLWAWIDESSSFVEVEAGLYDWFSRLDDSFGEQSTLAVV